MTNDQKLTVKRRYFKPIDPDPEFEKMTKATRKYMIRERSRMCITCNNPATQLLCSDVDGATFTERYCDTCIKENKHNKESEVMQNFDNLFTRAEPKS